jgi:hypothetical protein
MWLLQAEVIVLIPKHEDWPTMALGDYAGGTTWVSKRNNGKAINQL